MPSIRPLPGALLCVLLVSTLSACPEDAEVAPAITGTVQGTVQIEGEPAAGVTVSLDGGATTTTSASGTYTFSDVSEGAHVVEISGFPPDATFPQTAKTATITSDGEVRQVDFSGAFVRTAAVVGTVRVDGEDLEGVTVSLSGRGSGSTTTDGDGGYAFEGLRAGRYTVSISELPDDVAFDETAKDTEVEVGGTGVVDFDGIRLDGEIDGRVVVEEEPQEGVTVTGSHAASGDTREDATGPDGGFVLQRLRPGPWTIVISGWDDTRVRFDDPDREVDITDADPTASLSFEGAFLPGTVSGTVTLDDEAAQGVDVRLTDAQGAQTTATTDASGAYLFAEVPTGAATVTVAAGDDVACEDHPRQVEVPAGGAATADFDCATRAEPVSFETDELSFAQGPVAPDQTGSMPVRNEGGEVVGQAMLETGSSGAYFRDLQRFYWDAPGSFTLRFATLQVFALYQVLVLHFYEAYDVGPNCLLEMALLDPTGQVLTAVTFAAVAQQALSLDLSPEAAAVRLGFVAVVAGACANAYASLGSGDIR